MQYKTSAVRLPVLLYYTWQPAYISIPVTACALYIRLLRTAVVVVIRGTSTSSTWCYRRARAREERPGTWCKTPYIPGIIRHTSTWTPTIRIWTNRITINSCIRNGVQVPRSSSTHRHTRTSHVHMRGKGEAAVTLAHALLYCCTR